ncbi:hypothetical protein FA95DRAFT_125028 [Auriscalpium vulgare]|uniref:Uncharacterized protein n=1 Tax=Auriscalpium vulgare TaxID=40419 RepID=A0ACB8RNB4_9AGAM|nr:hypothetical protein FA95DRAFT_125028 [Auriscalpium vulgare]
MDGKEVHGLADSSLTSPTEAWLSTLRSQLSRIDSSSPDSLAALRNERAAIASVLQIVNARINESAPILRLPPKLIVPIFSYFANGVLSERVPSMDHLPVTVPWVRLTWVCQRWRHIILSSPTLWCDIVWPLSPQWAREMLVRSQRHPLSISYGHKAPGNEAPEHGAPASSQGWVPPFDTLEQVRSMHIHFDAAGDYSQLLSTPAPILEVAFMDIPGDLPREALFANCAPRLRNLTIRGARVSPLSSFLPFLPNIVSLDIGYIEEPPSLPEFIAALQRLKRVETLTLAKCLHHFSCAPASPAASQVARLPSLNLLDLDGTVSECVGFLRHVQTPDTACLHIGASTPGGVDDFAVLYPFLAPACGYGSNPFRDMRFQSYGPGDLTLSARHNLDADEAPCDREFVFNWEAHEETAFGLVSALCAEVRVCHSVSLSLLVPLWLNWEEDSVECLKVGWEDDGPDCLKVPPEDWLGMIGAVTELRTLHADAHSGPMLCQVLSTSMLEDGTYGREAEGIPVWPKLQVLKLVEIDLSFCYEEDNSWAEFIGMRVDEVLLRELEHRYQRDAALNTLHLMSCRNIYPAWLESVERVVDRVLVTVKDPERDE